MNKNLKRNGLLVLFAVCLNIFGFSMANLEVRSQSHGDAFTSNAVEGDPGDRSGYNTGSQTEQITNGAAPILQGATPGTIGPPGAPFDRNKKKNKENKSANLKTMAVGSFFFLSIGACVLAMFKRNNQKKNSIWVNGGIAALVMMVSGLAWGNLGWYY